MWKYQNLKFDKNTNIINKNVHTSVTTRPSPASRTVVEAFTSHRFTRQSIVAPTHFATAVAIVTRWAGRLAGVTLVARFTLTPAVLARQRRQCCYLTKARSTLATMSKQHCRSNRQQSCLLLRQCSVLGNNVEATFDIVAFDNVASTFLLVWTGLNAEDGRRGGVFLPPSVCVSVFPNDISKTDAATITKLDTEMFHD